SSRRRHTRSKRDWSSDVCSSDLPAQTRAYQAHAESVARNDGEMTLSARSIEDLADALSRRPNVVQIGTRQAGQLALAGAGANKRSEERRVGRGCRGRGGAEGARR